MKHITQKELKRLIEYGYAEDITRLSFEQVNELRKNENGLECLQVSIGTYGLNGAMLRGYKTKTLYAVKSRSSNLLSLV